MSPAMKALAYLLSWIPLLLFFGLVTTMFLADFNSPVDEYFVQIVLRSVLILILSAFYSQIMVGVVFVVLYFLVSESAQVRLHRNLRAIDSFPIQTLSIFSVALFFEALNVDEWVLFLAITLLLPTMNFWARHGTRTLKKLREFAANHQVQRGKSFQVILPFYLAFAVDYFFVALKRGLLPLVFVLVVSDYRIMLPKLVDAGLTYQAILLFFCLFLSLHVVSYKERSL